MNDKLKLNKPDKIRKLIDLDRNVLKKLQLQSVKKDYGSVKEYIEKILKEASKTT